MQADFSRLKQQNNGLDDQNDPLSNQERFEWYQQLLKRLDQMNNDARELARSQRLLTNKGHRIDQRPGGDLTINLKSLEGQIHHEVERVERNIQAENDFHHLERELDSYLKISTEQFRLAQEQSGDKSVALQVHRLEFVFSGTVRFKFSFLTQLKLLRTRGRLRMFSNRNIEHRNNSRTLTLRQFLDVDDQDQSRSKFVYKRN